MGRKIKRVPLDFDWPLNDVWKGYLPPSSLDEVPCPAGENCRNGVTAARAWVAQLSKLLLMLDDDRADARRGCPMHPYFDSTASPFAPSMPRPSEDIAEFGAGLAGRQGGPLGHDAYDRWRAEKRIIEAAGLDPNTWGICPACQGSGSVEAYPGQDAQAEAWRPTEPPAGDGWQLWETVSEGGAPISPVFATAEELARWLTTPAACWGAMSMPMTIGQARGFVCEGWAPSMIGSANGIHDGATFVGTQAVDALTTAHDHAEENRTNE